MLQPTSFGYEFICKVFPVACGIDVRNLRWDRDWRATIVIGGIFTSTALALIVLPALYHLFEENSETAFAPEWV